MGLEYIAVGFRVEEEFGVPLGDEEWNRLLDGRTPFDMTAGELDDFICEACRSAGKPIPHDSWARLKLLLADELGVDPQEVRKDVWLTRDLGMG